MSENEQQNVSRETPGSPHDPLPGVSRETHQDKVRSDSAGPHEASAPPKKGKGSSFFIYLAVLFGAAFLMLLLAYLIQQRNNQTTIDGLQDNWKLSREELVEEIAKLKGDQEGLEAQIADLEQQLKQEQERSAEFQTMYDGARTSASHLEYCLYKRSEAMELFWQLDRAYTQGRNQRCQELIALMEAPEGEPLKSYLPADDIRDNYDNGGYADDWPSPAERYQEIFEKLS